MAEKSPREDAATKRRGPIIGVALTVIIGLILLRSGDGLRRASYDLPFPLRSFLVGSKPTDEVVMVYLDSKVKANLGQPMDQPLDRHFHTELLQRLTDDGARLVLYDILFDLPHLNPEVDEQFATAIRRNGHVVLIGDYIKQLTGNVIMDAPLPPLPKFVEAGKWGLAKVYPDPDLAIRQIDAGAADYPSVSWVAATMLGAPVTLNPELRRTERWLNYYCPPENLTSVNFDTAIARDQLSPGYFRGKIVVVGARPSGGVGLAGAEREEFPNPYSRFQNKFNSSGPAIHALSLLNLLHQDWLSRMSIGAELVMILAWGIFISTLLLRFRPWLAVVVAVMCALLFGLAAAWWQMGRHVWFPWLIPASAQTSVALVWSVGYQFVVADRRRRQLRQAFGSYLSPYMADQISNSEFELALGGKEVEATVMFTDLEGFTKMSETLAPTEVSKILTTYFNQTTRVILEQDGTIIKYIGDAVFAVWGAPVADPKHAERAVLAAWGMCEAGKKEVEGRRLRTRLGVNTGMVLAGNLGSDFRFDYTLIGDTVNFAARLEGLNKYMGTDILISESTRAKLSDQITVRALGKFIVVGKKSAVGIYEVLGLAENFPQDPPWLTEFARGLDHFNRRDLDEAEKCFRAVIASRDGKDGPSQLYLAQIETARRAGPGDTPWDGTVRITEK